MATPSTCSSSVTTTTTTTTVSTATATMASTCAATTVPSTEDHSQCLLSSSMPHIRNKVRKFKFVEGWLSDPEFKDWLIFNKAENTMTCRYCTEAKLGGVWISGTNNYRKKTLETHVTSELHRHAAAGFDVAQPTIDQKRREMNEQEKMSYVAAMRSAYWLALEEMPNRKHASLINLQRLQGCEDIRKLHRGGNSTKESPWAFNQLLTAMDEVLVKETVDEVRQSPYIGVGLDESTDRASEKHVVFIVRYLAKDHIKTTYLKIAKIKDGKAATIYQTLTDVFQSYHIPRNKILSLGIDGASVMLSDKNGVVGLHKEQSPFSVSVHCVCHRLALAVSKAAKNVPNVNTLQLIVAQIYQHVNNSPNRLARFKDMASLLTLLEEGEEEDNNRGGPTYKYLKFKRVFDIRWLCLGEAVKAVIHNYEPLVLLLEEEAAQGDPQSIGLHQQLTNYKFVALLHLVGDVLAITNHLNRILQYRDISFMGIKGQITNVIQTLEELRHEDGDYLAKFMQHSGGNTFYNIQLKTNAGRGEVVDQHQQFIRDKGRMLDAVIAQIMGRFPQLDLLDAMQVFEPAAYPEDGGNLNAWGRRNMDILLDHYATRKHTPTGRVVDPLIDADQARGEFMLFKRLLHANRGEQRGEEGYHTYRVEEVFTKVFGGDNRINRRIYPEMFKLMLLGLVVLPSNAEAERSFSVQNRIKTKLRCRLSIERLDQLIRVSYHKVALEDFDFDRALVNYMDEPHRWY